MALVDSLLSAMVRADGDALVMHVGERPYVVTKAEALDLSTHALNLGAMTGMLQELLPAEQQSSLEEFGAIEHTLPSLGDDRFTMVAARGGDDIWIEIRRRRTAPAVAVAEPAGTPAVALAERIAEPAAEAVADVAAAPEPEMAPVLEVAAAPEPAAEPEPALEMAAPAEQVPEPEPIAKPEPIAGPEMAPVLDVAAAPEPSAEHAREDTGELRRDLADLSAVASAEAEAASGREGGAREPHAKPEIEPTLEVAAIPEPEVEPSVEPVVVAEFEVPIPELVAAMGSSGSSQHFQSEEPVEYPRTVEPVRPAERLERVEPGEPGRMYIDPLSGSMYIRPGSTDSTGSSGSSGSTDSTGPSGATGSTGSNDCFEIEEPVEHAKSAEPVEHAEHVESAKPVEPDEPVAPAEPASARDPDVVLPMTRTVRIEVPTRVLSQSRASTVERLLQIASARGASTLFLTSDSRPYIRVEGDLRLLEGEALLSKAEIEAAVMEIVPEEVQDSVRRGEPTEWIAELPELGRIRCTSFWDHRGPGVVFNMIATRAATAEQLALPRDVQAFATEAEGLVLVAGPRGSGKSTLVSALIDLINRQRTDYVIMLERQIRLVHDNRTALVSQREILGGADEALAAARAALRENPDVLVVDDLSSAQMVPLLLEAAAGGLLVFVSMTAPSTADAVERLLELAPAGTRTSVQAAMAEAFRGAVSQVLLKKTGGGRVVAREIMLATAAVTRLIGDGQLAQLPVALESGKRHGMVPLTDVLLGLVQSGVVDVREAFRKTHDRDRLLSGLKREGIDTTAVERLA